VIPNELKDHAMLIVQQIRQLGYDKNFCVQLEEKIINNNYTHLLKDLMMQTLLLDRKRGENLFDLLPLKNYVWNLL
jgi:hypothetical protein